MKVAVFTFFHNGNFGSELQSIAMGQYLSKLKHDVCFCKSGYKNKRKKILAYAKKKCIDVYMSSVNSEYRQSRKALKKNIILQCPVSLQTKKLIIDDSKKLNNYEIVDEEDGGTRYDAYICGSDQIWSPFIMPLKKEYYLANVPSDRKIAYAPSFGVNELPRYHANRIKKYISDFEYLSVREDSAISIVEKLCNKKVVCVLDPTMLLTPDEWKRLIDQNSNVVCERPYIFAYFLGELDENTKLFLEQFAQEREIVLQPKREKKMLKNQLSNDMGVFDFLAAIRDSQYVITDSFHGTVFSILLKKKFVVFQRNNVNEIKQTSRIESLLRMTGLQSCFWDGKESIEKLLSKEINYELVHQVLEKYRYQSQSFLKCALNDIEKKRGKVFE